MILRDYQINAIQAIDAEHAKVRSTLLVMATGTGKTVVFMTMAKERAMMGLRTLVIAHRRELVEQAARCARDLSLSFDIEMADSKAGTLWKSDVVVASVQTLQQKHRLEGFCPEEFGLVVIDEAHHAVAASYKKVVAHFLTAPRCRVVGVTATPDRGDGSAMKAMFASAAFEYGIQQGIADGYLARITQKRIDVDGLDLSALKTNAGDFSESELEEILTQEKHLHAVAEPTVALAGNRPTIVFCASVAHAQNMAEIINRYSPAGQYGQAAVALDGTSDPEHRASTLRAFSKRHVQFLVNCALFLEGTDLPLTACVAMARPTKSRALYAQAVGRGTRICPGKTDLLVLDFVGISGKHKLISPTDILAGKSDDEEVLTIAKRISGTTPDPEEALAKARDEAGEAKKRREAAIRVKAKTKIFDTDPFGALGMVPPAPEVSGETPTAVQLEKLKKYGVPITEEMTKAQCAAIIYEMHRRREAGLCTYKQARFLEKRGVADAKRLTFDQASSAITSIAVQQGWGRAS